MNGKLFKVFLVVINGTSSIVKHGQCGAGNGVGMAWTVATPVNNDDERKRITEWITMEWLWYGDCRFEEI